MYKHNLKKRIKNNLKKRMKNNLITYNIKFKSKRIKNIEKHTKHKTKLKSTRTKEIRHTRPAIPRLREAPPRPSPAHDVHQSHRRPEPCKVALSTAWPGRCDALRSCTDALGHKFSDDGIMSRNVEGYHWFMSLLISVY